LPAPLQGFRNGFVAIIVGTCWLEDVICTVFLKT